MMLRPGVRSDELDAEVEPFVPVGFEDELFPEDAPDAGGGGTRVRDDRCLLTQPDKVKATAAINNKASDPKRLLRSQP